MFPSDWSSPECGASGLHARAHMCGKYVTVGRLPRVAYGHSSYCTPVKKGPGVSSKAARYGLLRFSVPLIYIHRYRILVRELVVTRHCSYRERASAAMPKWLISAQ